MSRRFARIALLGVLTTLGSSAWAAESLGLRTIPAEIYTAEANPKEGLEGWVFFLIVESDSDIGIVPVDLTLEYMSAGQVVREEVLPQAALSAIAFPGVQPRLLTGEPPATPTFWPHAFRLVAEVPASLEIDEVRARLRGVRGRQTRTVSRSIPIRHFSQQTHLIFPFVGKGLITQTGALEAGHRNRSGLHAIDALGLTEDYAPVLDDGDSANSYAGWGREIIAPADGVVVGARGDRPDQPLTGTSDPRYFAPGFANGGDPGNHVVIDHGNGEFSMIAHMQHGSVRVGVGDKVMQGQVLGLLGSSGDTTGPHVHYQLQRGREWQYADGLPVTFDNVAWTTRGAYFYAAPVGGDRSTN